MLSLEGLPHGCSRNQTCVLVSAHVCARVGVGVSVSGFVCGRASRFAYGLLSLHDMEAVK